MNKKNNLRQRRKELGLTQLDVAKAVGVSEATVSRWESGNIAEVGSGKIAALAGVLQLQPSQLLGTAQNVPNTPAKNQQDDLSSYLEQLRTRPEMRAFFSLAQNATKRDVEDAMHIVEAYFAGRNATKQQEED